MEYLVSFNITHDKTLLNPSNAPVLYYSHTDDINKLSDELSNDEEFTHFIDENIRTEQYGYSKVTYFVFTINSEEYNEKIVNLQDICNLNKLTSLKLKFIREIFEYLYEYSHKNEPLDLSEFENDIDIILHIYDILKSKYSEKVSPVTIREYVHSQLKQVYYLSDNNIDLVLRSFDEIIM